ncbi:MAG: DUF1015 domain-containing protein [Desulfarculales bacterium]|jgi:uncharacterized protein (DUF1015 family)|nr:DUF1015 domain-containing protein [Desulfarculales bacterium]
MAAVEPFRGLRYQINEDKELARLVTPPYDVISQARQNCLYENHPNNIIRLELNRPEPGDSEDSNIYTRAARFLREWTAAGILKTEEKPSLYINETTFTDAGGQTLTRRGFFARLRLEEFASGIVLPHERTFSGHKEDRLKLIKETKTNISPIMALYPDPSNQVQAIFRQSAARHLAEFDDPAGWHQHLLAVDEPEAIAAIQEVMREKTIFIADGHHRYETGLNYRRYVREQNPALFDAAAPCNYILTYLCSMSDPGLTVFASHRVLPQWKDFSLSDFQARLEPFFAVSQYPLSGNGEKDTEFLREKLHQAGKEGVAFGFMAKGRPHFWLMTLKDKALEKAAMQESEPALQSLDVVILSELVLNRGLGLSTGDYDKINLIEYISGLTKAVQAMNSGRADLAFFLNPTKIEQVRAVAEKGLIMPRKSTYFYPKVLTGLVMNPVE